MILCFMKDQEEIDGQRKQTMSVSLEKEAKELKRNRFMILSTRIERERACEKKLGITQLTHEEKE